MPTPIPGDDDQLATLLAAAGCKIEHRFGGPHVVFPTHSVKTRKPSGNTALLSIPAIRASYGKRASTMEELVGALRVAGAIPKI